MTEAGRIIGGKYRLRKRIGEGAMGSVWSAVHETLGRTAAVKFLSATDGDPETASARFVAEARMAASIKHRFIVDIFDFGITEDGLSYMVLELLDGEELGELLGCGPPLQVRDAVKMIAQCLTGLEEVHKAGIIHRDLKPENIFLMRDSDGMYPKLLDFGISKMRDGNASMGGVSMRPGAKVARRRQLTAPGTVLGTPWYMAPEQLRGLPGLNERIDIYAMGVILYEMLTGQVPFEHENTADLLLAVMSEGPADLMLIRPDLGEELADILAMAMSTDPKQRYESARHMRRALEGVIDKLPQAWTVVQSGGDDEAVRTGRNAVASDSVMPPTPPRPTRDKPQRAVSETDEIVLPVHGLRRGLWASVGGAAVIITLLAMGLSDGDEADGDEADKVKTMAPAPEPQAAEPEVAQPEVAQPAVAEAAAKPGADMDTGDSNSETDDAPPAPKLAATPNGPAAKAAAKRRLEKKKQKKSGRKKFRSLDF